ncbi:MAG: hypothetical protein KKH75_08175, partial [Actinobacteria bacterium]|nr:hypothetical protein [Actinomycetota bacterium]
SDDDATADDETSDSGHLSTREWQRIRAWALNKGWDEDRVNAWLESVRSRSDHKTPASAVPPSEEESPSSDLGSKREQSPTPSPGVSG